MALWLRMIGLMTVNYRLGMTGKKWFLASIRALSQHLSGAGPYYPVSTAEIVPRSYEKFFPCFLYLYDTTCKKISSWVNVYLASPGTARTRRGEVMSVSIPFILLINWKKLALEINILRYLFFAKSALTSSNDVFPIISFPIQSSTRKTSGCPMVDGRNDSR